MEWLMSKAGRGKDKKPQPATTPEEPKLFLEPKYLGAQIIDFDIREVVRLPKGLDHNEWLGSNTLELFNNVNVLYGVTSSEACTNDTCPSMSAPGNTQYFWHDDKGKKLKVTAPQYINYAMSYIQKHITDEAVLPTKYGHVFPGDFEQLVQRVLRLLFHITAHIYQAHFELLVHFDLHRHLNSLFCQMVLFSQEFHVLDAKDYAVLDDLIEALGLNNVNSKTASNNASGSA
ncbi:MOB kinase activator 2-like [Patiria miniata]|uniref:MOB kinase activator-like 2 n=1 Tax=Patiria miniata TaxID=46514 RepID=A0A913Z897_PATMI|nr:MOB kinase activator 2-like [Patiria miniata]